MRLLEIFDIKLQVGLYTEMLSSVLSKLDKHDSAYICLANSHMIVESKRNYAFNRILRQADMVVTDGMPLTWICSLFLKEKIERVAGMDIFNDLLKGVTERKHSVFFYGNTQETLSDLIQQVTKDYPDILVAGSYSPPFRILTKAENLEIIDMINSVSPSLVFVSLGCPKQEIWMFENRGKINSVMIGVGNAFLTYLGVEKRLPEKYRNWGFEWFYRLIQNPKRLWKRYMITNSLFLFYSTIEIKNFYFNGNQFED